ncbi:S5A-REDUCTASE domain-containing protein [Mycena chlorophos]|uniref:S5A-REDUCTASE domain-containing protein n=1 Tax=Mycena chlorophos TaxID=658473 RepID=A0A8H6TGY1_MYCCL|nr:S5A-REDUCTASE domain-containing protein [Mycena chlorophos]
MAVLSRLLPTAASSYLLQSLFALVFVPQAEDRYYDLGGAAGFLTSTFVSLYYPALKAKFWNGVPGPLPSLLSFAPRQLLVNAALGLWSVRLGSFLAMRAYKAGGDSRFDEIKHDPRRFTYYWLAQATWVMLVGLPVYMVNALPPALHPVLGPLDYAALGIFAGSFLFEVIADRQKTAWRRARDAKLHEERFITSGLWSISRHPNYVGEVGIWTGIWAMAAGSVKTPYYPLGTLAIAAISPVFTWFLVRKVSGVPPLERAGDKRFGGDPKWENYKKTVPIFWPWGST